MRVRVYGLRCMLAYLLLALVPVSHGLAAADELAYGLCVQLLRAPHDPELTDQLRAVIGRLEDDGARARYGAVYTLSLLATGHASGLRLQAYMLQNFPESPYTRLVEPLYLSRVCPDCDGTLARQVSCDRCAGSGQCPSCRGSGRSRVRGFDGAMLQCRTCQGGRRCPDCGGQAVVDAVCRRCTAGRVVSSERADAIYHDLLLHIVEGVGLPEVVDR